MCVCYEIECSVCGVVVVGWVVCLCFGLELIDWYGVCEDLFGGVVF